MRLNDTVRPGAGLALAAACGMLLAAPAHAQDLSALTGENQRPLQITGFAVGDYTYDGRTHDNSFSASTIAVSLFKEVTDQIWFFGQLTTSEDGTEIDNLIASWTPAGAPQFNLSAGKFDAPIGFERDDAPLNLQISRSFVSDLSRPTKLVGLVGRWAVSPQVDVTAMLSNGWDADISQNHGKTGGVRLGWIPNERTSFGVAGLYGPEGPADSTVNRYALTLDYAYQPTADWILAGEGDWGGDRNALLGGGDARWYGAQLSLFRRLGRSTGALARAEVFRDPDGARTGTRQTMESYTFAPVYFIGAGREGVFANIEHTTFRIPRFQLRAEARLNHSNVPVFATATGPGTWGLQFALQLVTLF
jgi:Putative beta-barrel porin-2, OmpL-like. bbp2